MVMMTHTVTLKFTLIHFIKGGWHKGFAPPAWPNRVGVGTRLSPAPTDFHQPRPIFTCPNLPSDFRIARVSGGRPRAIGWAGG